VLLALVEVSLEAAAAVASHVKAPLLRNAVRAPLRKRSSNVLAREIVCRRHRSAAPS
jgi:hypothetical protein